MISFISVVVLAITAVIGARASHTISFINNCGFGTPTLLQGNTVLSTGGAFTSNGWPSAIAFLQTGSCGINGEDCTFVDITPTNSGSGVSVNISVPPPPLSARGSVKFAFTNGCSGTETCTGTKCATTPVECDAPNANLAITFCV
ncbi:hypothetical protein BDN70DRAFT_882125 [Pholiota conissans]|uniref:Glycopeptide n=1 Tax=Pholiota conissans TaxID=109636 RepID=A0A9P5YVP1_9AGAR|nr:hypothetical protein BDN70DRAFT_882125 [Pholiota conissans]